MPILTSEQFVAPESFAVEVWEEEGGALQQAEQVAQWHEVDDINKINRAFFIRELQRDFGVYES